MTRRDQGSVVSPNWAPEKETLAIEPGADYGTIQCVPAEDMPDFRKQINKVPRGFWTPLIDDLLLRLEQTPRREALLIPFASRELARRAYHSITNEALRRVGLSAVEVRRQGSMLYVRRGENWGKTENPVLAALAK